MRARIISRARLREPSLIERFEYYEKLCRGRLRLERALVKGELQKHVPRDWRAVALDERGEELTSAEFSKHVARWMGSGTTGVAFLMGEADGLTPDELAVCNLRLSLSRMTLPHQLAFVVVAEQLYRATTILRGERYHR